MQMNPDLLVILHIGDNPADTNLVDRMLSFHNEQHPVPTAFAVIHTDRLSSGLARLNEGNIDLILLDLSLPDSQGVSSVEQLRDCAPNIPILVLSDENDATALHRIIQNGAEDCLIKQQTSTNDLEKSVSRVMERQRMMRSIFEQNADGIIVVDSHGIVRMVNKAAEALFDRSQEALLNQPFGFPVVSIEKAEIDIVRRNGEVIIAEMRVARSDMDGETHYIASLRDITELARLRDELQTASFVDELTGLYNRRGFLMLTQQQLKLAERLGTGAWLLFADMDNLKQINDQLGHVEGDTALQEAAVILRQTFRHSDIVARLSGDEFAVFLVEQAHVEVGTLITRLQRNVAERNRRVNGRYPLSFSIGSAYYDPHHPVSLTQLLMQADEAMYLQKKSRKRHSSLLQNLVR
jgi:diguanylate cyclase (GGDEF)-like protein